MATTMAIRRVCIFCGASSGVNPAHMRHAREVGAELARRGIGVVYGGGRVGLMGAVADGALGEGGEVHGVIPRALVDRELAHRGVTQLHVVETLHERKALMVELSDAFIALPGGIGTLDELSEVLSWGQLGLHDKPIGVLDPEGYFDPLLAFLDHVVAEGFAAPADRRRLHVARRLDTLIDRFAAADTDQGAADADQGAGDPARGAKSDDDA